MSVLTDLSSLSDTVQTYWTAIASYLAGSTSAPPSADFLTGVTYGDLAALLERTFDSNVGFTQGSLRDRADAYNGYARDITLRSLTKSQLYAQAAQELGDMITWETAEVAKATNYATGQTIFQHHTLS